MPLGAFSFYAVEEGTEGCVSEAGAGVFRRIESNGVVDVGEGGEEIGDYGWLWSGGDGRDGSVADGEGKGEYE